MFDKHTHRPALLPPAHPPVLCVVVDTEEEFDWAKPFSRQNVGVESIAAQILAHEKVYDQFGIVPTYVVDWPVANMAASVAVLKSLMDEGRCEIGTHLHPWVSPPHLEEVNTFNSYTGNLPGELEFAKLQMLTDAIASNFQRQPAVFKAGRYGLGQYTSLALQKLGYLIDASVVPHTSFATDGGPDFTGFDNQAFWFGSSAAPLLELPVTTGYCGALRPFGHRMYPLLNTPFAKSLHLGGIAARTRMLERIRLTPEGTDAHANSRLMKALVQSGTQVLTMTYHSPSLAPGNTPYVQSAQEVVKFVDCIKQCCDYFKNELGGVFMGLSQVRQATLMSSKKVAG